MSDSFIQLGQIEVHTTNNKGHDPEFWAQQTTNKILGISENAPEHVKLQAEAFKNHIYSIILSNINNAIDSKKVTMVGLLTKQGHEDMAKIIKEL
tara:strand:- start:73 stop:357 length:285 start_codon:yes stop_codon:yes gene_type:complete